MVAETLPSSTPQVDNHSGPGVKTQSITEQHAKVKKNVSSNNADRSGSRQQRLVSHLLIGFLMTVIALAGYLFLGPHAHASAADQAGNHIVNVATDVPPRTSSVSVVYDQGQMSDLITIQAKMADITNRMNALKAENVPSNAIGNTAYSSTSGYSQDPMSTKLDQMILMMDDIMTNMNSFNTQPNGTNNPASGAGHGHH